MFVLQFIFWLGILCCLLKFNTNTLSLKGFNDNGTEIILHKLGKFSSIVEYFQSLRFSYVLLITTGIK